MPLTICCNSKSGGDGNVDGDFADEDKAKVEHYVPGAHKALTLVGGPGGFNATTNTRDQVLNANSWRFLP